MGNKLSPEIVNGLKERGIDLTSEEIKSINTILPDGSQELSMDQLDQTVGGMSGWKKVAIGGGIAAGVAVAALCADGAHSYLKKDDQSKGIIDGMYSKQLFDKITGYLKGKEDTSTVATN